MRTVVIRGPQVYRSNGHRRCELDEAQIEELTSKAAAKAAHLVLEGAYTYFGKIMFKIGAYAFGISSMVLCIWLFNQGYF